MTPEVYGDSWPEPIRSHAAELVQAAGPQQWKRADDRITLEGGWSRAAQSGPLPPPASIMIPASRFSAVKAKRIWTGGAFAGLARTVTMFASSARIPSIDS